MRWQKWKLHLPLCARGEIELYDLSNDPGERNNLAPQKPEFVQELTTRLKAWTALCPRPMSTGM